MRNAVQYIVKDVGGTVEIYLQSLPSSATVTLETNTGSSFVDSQSATISSYNETLTSDASQGSSSISVSSATGILPGTSLLLSEPSEEVEVKSISGSSVELWAPLFYSHTQSTAVTGNRVSYDVSASEAQTGTFFGGRVVWTIDGKRVVSALECTKTPIVFNTSLYDIYSIDPGFVRFIDANENLDNSLRGAFVDVLNEIGSRGRVHIFTAGPEFNRLVALKYMCILHMRHGDKTKDILDGYKEEYASKLGNLISGLPADVNQDGISSDSERQQYNSFPIGRK